MATNILQKKGKELYSYILKNKFITVCVLFAFFTLLDTITILLGLFPAKVGLNPYVHLLGRFVLHSILVCGLFVYDKLRKRVKSRLLIYVITFILTWGLLMCYLWINTLFTELHPNAFVDGSRSYASMYLILGIVLFLSDKTKVIIKNIKNNK